MALQETDPSSVGQINISTILSDPRVRQDSKVIDGKTYGYLVAEPDNGYKRTVFLIHGFPHLSISWMYQIPLFLRLGFRVICPDCMGYGRSDAPTGTIVPYSFKSHADDFVVLLKQLGCQDIILGGHDWGAVIASRMVLYHPSFVTHYFAFAIPYIPPRPGWVETKTLVKAFPSLAYQLQLGSEDGIVEAHTQSKEEIRLFLNAAYDAHTPDGQYALDVTRGVDFDLLPSFEPTKLLQKQDMDYFVDEYSRNGLRGPCNYYRTRRQNFLDEEALIKQGKDASVIKCPMLFVRATAEHAVTTEIVERMKPFTANLTLKEVDSGHWVLWEKPAVVNSILVDWMEQEGLIELRN
ncbi:alpha/beta hydrolase [Penicillium capsulatum]|uniref:Alpha/beta hydrolase n=1 Tax=Penicillium capsulatum TaxID=69766 RepID=A0A9W9I417_9EURO|nr:alpha/beta hydrolase [Penicillium capsulatum]KAJ6116785.1 alpha/beta hydrolase [Penicillium capsulatum]